MNDRLSQKEKQTIDEIRKKGKALFTKITRSDFIYYTQYDLAVERNRYAQYLEQCEDSDKFIITFNRNLANKHFNRQLEEKILTSEGLLLWNYFPIKLKNSKEFRTMANNFFCICCNRKKHLIFTEFDRDSFTGFSYRRFSYIYAIIFWSLFIFLSCFAAIVSIGLTSDRDAPYFDITNSITTAILAIATLALGAASINWCWAIPHDLYHDNDEKTRYRDNFGQIIYRLKLKNLLEKIETKITNDIINDQMIFDDENKLCNTIRKKFKENFNHPDILHEIENAITKQINELPNKTFTVQDLLEDSGEDLKKIGRRRAYVKRFLGEEIKKAIKDHTCYQIKRNYGFFTINESKNSNKNCDRNCFEIKKDKPLEPNDDCYSFDDIRKFIR